MTLGIILLIRWILSKSLTIPLYDKGYDSRYHPYLASAIIIISTAVTIMWILQ